MDIDYNNFLDTQFECEVMLGKSKITVKEFLSLDRDNIIILDSMVGDGSSIYVNSRVIGNGEVLVYDEKMNIKIKDVSSADEAIEFFYAERSN